MKIEMRHTYELDIEGVKFHLTKTDAHVLRDKLNEILGEKTFLSYEHVVRGAPLTAQTSVMYDIRNSQGE